MTTPLFKVFVPPEAITLINQTLQSGFIAEGQNTKKLTQLVIDYIGNKNVIPVNSCTTAIKIAYRLCGVGPGSEVISTPLTCIAGNVPIVELGGEVVWADIDIETGMITAETIEPLITERTKAIYVLHKEGSPADISRIYELAHSNGIKVVEDAAHAFGSKVGDDRIGKIGDFVCFSFQAIKHITTGDGGMLICGNDDDYERAKKLKWFGIDRDKRIGRDVWHEDIEEIGYKGNMNDLSAALGISQFNHIDEILDAFNSNGNYYSQRLADCNNIKLLRRNANNFHTYWGYTILTNNRQHLQNVLSEKGIEASQIHVRNDNYSIFNKSKRHLPNVDLFDKMELALPCGWWLDKTTQDEIISLILEEAS